MFLIIKPNICTYKVSIIIITIIIIIHFPLLHVRAFDRDPLGATPNLKLNKAIQIYQQNANTKNFLFIVLLMYTPTRVSVLGSSSGG
jgi:hypothetical protein